MAAEKSDHPSAATLADWVRDARQRTLALVADLSDEQLLGPHLSIVNPLLWEIGHLTWFQEKWVLRHQGKQPPIRADGDVLYDSAAVAHGSRWDLGLPSRQETLTYMQQVQDGVLAALQATPSAEQAYFVMLSVFHEDMHGEAFLYTRQTLGYPAPTLPGAPVLPGEVTAAGPLADDVTLPGGAFQLGATADEPFVFDNEKWAHAVELKPFAIARTTVTQGEFLEFVERGGYYRPELWCPEGWRWRQAVDARHPVYWRRGTGGAWMRRHYDGWLQLEPHRPVVHVNWFEAEAYCRWVGRRLPSEAEWEAAAALGPSGKRRFPWGDELPTMDRANLDGHALGTADVGAYPAGESACGCRQMLGNVWEWTADSFQAYPGFVVGPYREYSEPWFGTHKVLRGGCWATRGRLLRNTWRNFYTPDRRDVWAGFRTCARLET
jgi:iron(II)-dependent oxidoreductase